MLGYPAARYDVPGILAYLGSLPPDPSWTQQPAPDDGGGGFEAAPIIAPPPYDPNTDPAYQQLLAQLGLKEALTKTQTQQNIERLQQQGRIAIPRIQEQGVDQRRGIEDNWANRGLWRSGARLRDIALQRRTEGERIGDVNLAVANRTAVQNQNLQSQISDLAGQKAQALFQAKLAYSGA